uniref:SGNH hydrolase-type esterase domain-containing protein n=1 Tax=Tetradesmus obliquus TaxID=3088 RepID=A0A383VEL6_TETOB|eukprot:jgi/Sobl393_1/12868/SZX62816.1
MRVSWRDHSIDFHLDDSACALVWLHKNIGSMRKLSVTISIAFTQGVLQDVMRGGSCCDLLESLPQLPPSLVELDVHCCKGILQLPALPVGLKRLNTAECTLTTLPVIPASLTHLDCYKCSNPEKLPRVAHTSITELNCRDCSLLEELPDMPGSLERLRADGLTRVDRLPRLPTERLKLLHISGTAISELPSSFPSLEVLWCGDTRIQQLPQLPRCTVLVLHSCQQLQQLPDQLPASLIELDCRGCSGLQQLPAQLPPKLELLWLSNCTALEQLPALPSSLFNFQCEGCSSLRRLPDLSQCRVLRVSLKGCSALKRAHSSQQQEQAQQQQQQQQQQQISTTSIAVSPAIKAAVPPTPATAAAVAEADAVAAWGFDPSDPARASTMLAAAGTYQQVQGLYQHSLSIGRRQRALVNVGTALRLRRVVADLQAGKNVSVGVIGGSISWGFYMQRGVNDWFAMFTSWLRRAFPSATITQRNGCVPATTAEYVSMCLDKFVDRDVDLIFLEYAINDGYTDTSVNTQHAQAFERLIRKLLQLPHKPAVVLMQALAQGIYGARGLFYWTVEDHYGVLAQHYQLPQLSVRNGMYHEVLAGAPGFSTAEIYPDVEQEMQRHPSELGHKYMADVAVTMVQQVFQDMALAPIDLQDEWSQRLMQVPAPMFPGNLEGRNLACLIGPEFRSVVNASQHWTWQNDGTAEKPKWGYSTSSAGATLDITVDTRAGLVSEDAAETTAAHGTTADARHGAAAAADAGSGIAASAVRLEAAKAAAEPGRHLLSQDLQQQQQQQQQQQAEVRDEAWWEAQQAQAEEQERGRLQESYVGFQDADMLVWVGYTKTWRRGGRALLTCHGGCRCNNVTVEGYHRYKTTQSYMAKVYTQQAGACTVRVTVLSAGSSSGGGGSSSSSGSSSGGRGSYFKVSGVMVTRRIGDYIGGDHTDVVLLNAMQGEEYKLAYG